MRIRSLKTVVLLIAIGTAGVQAQSKDDRTAVRQVALDYIEGWYAGDGARMESALHPRLVKRLVISPANGESLLSQMDAEELVERAAQAGGSETPPDDRHKRVTILDIYGNAASVRIYASGWVDYLHMARWNGDWKIVNVLYELHPPAEEAESRTDR